MTVSASGLRRAVHRDVFAENIFVADAQPGRFVLVFQILRRVADDAAGVEPVAGADFGFARQINVRPDDASAPNSTPASITAIRPDLNGRVQLRLRMNDGRRMNHFRHR